MLKIKNKIGILLLVLLTISQKIYAKNYDFQTFTCADEIGPRLKFSIPGFEGNELEKKITFKVYESKNRKTYIVKKGNIKKLSSPIDTSYFYYKAHSVKKTNDYFEINFEFYPPSHLLIQTFNSQFSDLVCWKN